MWKNINAEKVEDYSNTFRMKGLIELPNSNSFPGNWYQQHPILQSFALALLKKENNYHDVRRRYEAIIIELVALFDETPWEEWEALIPYLPHINEIGLRLVSQIENPKVEEEVMARAYHFAERTFNFLFRHPEIKRPEWLEMGLKSSRYFNVEEFIGLFLNELGNYFLNSGKIKEALNYYEEALPFRKNFSHRSALANTFNNIGVCYGELGDHKKALSYYDEALNLHREENYLDGISTTLISKANSLMANKNNYNLAI